MGRSRTWLRLGIILWTIIRVTKANAETSLLKYLEENRRFTEILSVSLGELNQSSCLKTCKVLASRNAARSLMNIGDFKGAYIYSKYAEQIDPNDKINWQLSAYILLQNKEMFEFSKELDRMQLSELEKSRWSVITEISGPDEGSTKSNELINSLAEKKTFPENELSLLKRYANAPRKSPGLAGTLSAILPGSGLAYTGLYSSAATSFFLTAAAFYASSQFFHEKQYGAATGAFLLGSVFHVGSVGASVRSANEINRRNRLDERSQLLDLYLPILNMEMKF